MLANAADDQAHELTAQALFHAKPQGSGIGLYMVRAIVEQPMQGSVRSANAADGTVFTLSLPLRTATADPRVA